MMPPLRLLTAAAALLVCSRADTLTATSAGEVQPPPVGAGGIARRDAEALVAITTDAGDSSIRAARAALAEGATWRASAALAPALADPRRRTPTALLLAAAAAAEREEWATVDRLIAGIPDTTLGGFAPLLQARSALGAARSVMARQAYDAARRASAQSRDGTERGVRLALAARALDRLSAADSGVATAADSAAAAYRSAAAQLPTIADWLQLRAAEATRDVAARDRVYASVRLPAARARAAATEASARERAGDKPGAAAAYSALGRRAKALSLRLAAAGSDQQARGALRDSLVRLVTGQSGTTDARQGVELLDQTFGTLTPAEELVVARSAAASGPASRAAAAFERALAGGLGTARDRYSYATLLGRLGRTREASAELARVQATNGPLAGDAAYQRARLSLRSDPAGTREALQAVADGFPADTAAAASALALLADLAVDDGRDSDARALLLRLARQYPRSDRTPKARFDAAIIALAGGDAAGAGRELDLLRGDPRDTTPADEQIAAGYWAGRAAATAGDSARARARWRETMLRAPSSYYALLASKRLGDAAWRPTVRAVPNEGDDVVATTLRRIALLERIGFDPEAGWERDALTRWADSSATRLATTAIALRDASASSLGMRLARRALDRGAAPTTELYRALYPWPWATLVQESAKARSMDATLAAAVIRQESNFTPNATSAAGAVGLMQLMPPVGRSLWDALGAARGGVTWSNELLREPDVSITLGTRHLATSLARYPDPSFALAAYNAGQTPVARWRQRSGTNDPELFVERVPYDETRDYVRIVLRNRAFYEALY